MTNFEAIKAQCKLICNTCFVDGDVIKLMLLNEGLAELDEATPNDPTLIRIAIMIVKGWVETSRSENGISASIDMAALKNNIMFWCRQAGLDASEFVDDLITFDDGSNLW